MDSQPILDDNAADIVPTMDEEQGQGHETVLVSPSLRLLTDDKALSWSLNALRFAVSL